MSTKGFNIYFLYLQVSKTWTKGSSTETDAIKTNVYNHIFRMAPCPADVIRRRIKSVPCLKSRGTYLVREKLNKIIRKKKKELQYY